MTLLKPRKVALAHCDLMCGVYDPAQARIEAESVKAIAEKYQASDDEVFRQRCVILKEQRAELAKHHLWVLWTDYFKPPHLERVRRDAHPLPGATSVLRAIHGTGQQVRVSLTNSREAALNVELAGKDNVAVLVLNRSCR